MLIAKEFHSMAFAIVNGVGQRDVNILVAVKHTYTHTHTGKCHRKENNSKHYAQESGTFATNLQTPAWAWP